MYLLLGFGFKLAFHIIHFPLNISDFLSEWYIFFLHFRRFLLESLDFISNFIKRFLKISLNLNSLLFFFLDTILNGLSNFLNGLFDFLDTGINSFFFFECTHLFTIDLIIWWVRFYLSVFILSSTDINNRFLLSKLAMSLVALGLINLYVIANFN